MLSAKDISMVYETLLTSPGMGEVVRVSLSMPRKDALLLVKIIEIGLAGKPEDMQGGMLSSVTTESLSVLSSITADLLAKTGLTDMYSRLNTLQTK